MSVGELLKLRARNELENLMENAAKSLHRRAPPCLELRQPDSTGTRRYTSSLPLLLFWTRVQPDRDSGACHDRDSVIAPDRPVRTVQKRDRGDICQAVNCHGCLTAVRNRVGILLSCSFNRLVEPERVCKFVHCGVTIGNREASREHDYTYGDDEGFRVTHDRHGALRRGCKHAFPTGRNYGQYELGFSRSPTGGECLQWIHMGSTDEYGFSARSVLV
jgi:hypothetical protein